MVCESILNCEKLTYKKKDFWNFCFELILLNIQNVDYKGVREIMKVNCVSKLVILLNFNVFNHCLESTILFASQLFFRAVAKKHFPYLFK